MWILVENILSYFQSGNLQALTEEMMLLMWHIKKKKKKNLPPELNSYMLLLWFEIVMSTLLGS